MATYRISRKLTATPRVLEGFIGLEATSQRPVVVKRLVSPWSKEGLTFGGHFAWLSRTSEGCEGLPRWVEIGHRGEAVWLVHELHEGESLRRVVSSLAKGRSFIAPNEGLAVIARVASVLVQLHGAPTPVVHGDVCATNVLLDTAGRVMLTDAQVTTLLAPSSTNGPARAEVFAIAPEQFTGASSTATDIFRLGLMLYELAVGQPLFYSTEAVQTLVACQRFMGVSREAVSQVPEPWQTLIIQMLSVEPRERPDAVEVDALLTQGAANAGWEAPSNDIARLLLRAYPQRESLASLAQGGAQELVLTPLSPVEPVAEEVSSPPPLDDEEQLPRTGNFSVLPGVPQSEPTPLPMEPPTARPTPSAPPMTPGAAVVGRISTRKMSLSEINAARPVETEARPPPPEAETVDPKAPRDAWLGKTLVDKGVITTAQLDEARAQVMVYGGTLADALSVLGSCDEDAIVTAVAEATRTPFTTSARLLAHPAPIEAMAKVPLDLARELDLVPMGLKGGTQLMVAMKDPMDSAALERLKVATGLKSVVAVRAAESAIRRVRNRFYLGVEDERPDWLERTGRSGVHAIAPVAAAAAPFKSTDSGAMPVVTGAPLDAGLGTLEQKPETPTLESAAGRLVTSLLMLLGERGTQARWLSSVGVSVARYLGVPSGELERLRFGITALIVANYVDGRPAFDVPTIGSLAGVLGEGAWNQLEPTIGPWLDWPAAMPEQASARAVCLALAYASHAGLVKLTGNRLAAALTSFKARFRVDDSLVAALTAALGEN